MTLLFGLFGQQALALCVSSDHRAVEVMGHAPCGPALQPDGDELTSQPRCDDTPVGGAMEVTLQQGKQGANHVIQLPGNGTSFLPASASMPKPPRMGTPTRMVTAHLDLRLRSRRTIVLLI
ncbi:hypothetical protein [Magnetospirillum sp. 64-120]|uniref:hypothetical protein n=1 Tax=Magnetospirillum sp. 64-120 TaxID=1895778 RepID=UPI0025C123CD|nr:hypothetical protein [Magnetospirillum sp. 64-120]